LHAAIAIEELREERGGETGPREEAGAGARRRAGNRGGTRVLGSGEVVGFAESRARRRRRSQFQDAKSW
jgi:hypothetical protein